MKKDILQGILISLLVTIFTGTTYEFWTLALRGMPDLNILPNILTTGPQQILIGAIISTVALISTIVILFSMVYKHSRR